MSENDRRFNEREQALYDELKRIAEADLNSYQRKVPAKAVSNAFTTYTERLTRQAEKDLAKVTGPLVRHLFDSWELKRAGKSK
jgi:hypothetical protein